MNHHHVLEKSLFFKYTFRLLYKGLKKKECVYFIIMLSRALDVLFTHDLVLGLGIVRIVANFSPRFFSVDFMSLRQRCSRLLLFVFILVLL